jgi:hypothetical protein
MPTLENSNVQCQNSSYSNGPTRDNKGETPKVILQTGTEKGGRYSLGIQLDTE